MPLTMLQKKNVIANFKTIHQMEVNKDLSVW